MGISTSLVSQQVKQTDRRFYFNTENFFNYSELVSEKAVLNEERTVIHCPYKSAAGKVQLSMDFMG